MMESGKRALFVPLVLRDAPASSGCLGYSSSCRWSACCCYANENISKLPEAAVVERVCCIYLQSNVTGSRLGPNLPGNTTQLIICEMMPFLISFLILGAVPFQPFLSSISPIPHYLYPSSRLVQFIYLISYLTHSEKEEGLVGREEGRREAAQSASSPHPHCNASLLGSHYQPRRQVSAITVN